MILPHLKINGVPIKNPSDLQFSTHNLTNSGRVATGKMTMEIVARKATLATKYVTLSDDEMDLIRSLIDAGEPFFEVEHLEHNAYQTYTMYAGAIHATHFRHDMGWQWKDISFDLIEQ